MIHFTISNVCDAKTKGIGTKIIKGDFFNKLGRGVYDHDVAQDTVPGQMYIPLPEAIGDVSCGVGPRYSDPEKYVLREHRGRVEAYLKREYAAPTESLAVVVYTAEAYLTDPEVKEDLKEFNRVKNGQYSHVVVAVLASAGPKSTLTSWRFVNNLAGGNKEANTWSAETIREIAGSIQKYESEWCVVSD